MAADKKSIIVYADWIDKFEELDDVEAGRLIKHFFRYVNDLNPEYPDRITKLSFIDIEKSLKRDLKKWENTLEGRSKAGKASAEARRLLKESQQNLTNPTSVDFVKQTLTNPTDSVNENVNVNENVSVKENIINNNSFSENCKTSEQWKETTAMQNKIKPDAINFFIDNFESHLITMEEQKKTLKEFKEHFSHWLRKQDLSVFKLKIIGKSNQL
jgi:hypothetical protein